jgi:hypothetical protein
MSPPVVTATVAPLDSTQPAVANGPSAPRKPVGRCPLCSAATASATPEVMTKSGTPAPPGPAAVLTTATCAPLSCTPANGTWVNVAFSSRAPTMLTGSPPLDACSVVPVNLAWNRIARRIGCRRSRRPDRRTAPR